VTATPERGSGVGSGFGNMPFTPPDDLSFLCEPSLNATSQVLTGTRAQLFTYPIGPF
jgi:hypothetical protein